MCRFVPALLAVLVLVLSADGNGPSRTVAAGPHEENGPESTDARVLAQKVLDQGAALFDQRNAAAMAATYVEDAEIVMVTPRSSDSNTRKLEVTRGRPAIEKAYEELFRNRRPEHKSKNTVQFAQFLAPDLLLIHGRFALDREQGDAVQFVQVRSREGDAWKVVTMQLMELPR